MGFGLVLVMESEASSNGFVDCVNRGNECFFFRLTRGSTVASVSGFSSGITLLFRLEPMYHISKKRMHTHYRVLFCFVNYSCVSILATLLFLEMSRNKSIQVEHFNYRNTLITIP